MTRTEIINELKKNGYNVVAQDVVKNGIKLDGICFVSADTNIAPVVYVNDLIGYADKYHKSINDVVAQIIKIYENSKNSDFNLDTIFDRNYILSHIFIALQKTGTENICKRDCGYDGIECYLYIRGNQENKNDELFSIKITSSILQNAGIAENEAWIHAQYNTNTESVIISIAKILAGYGVNMTDDIENHLPLYMVSNECKIRGASAILNNDLLIRFGRRFNTDRIVVFPSSIHEMLVAPFSDDMNIEGLSEMVAEINNTQVDEMERLTDRAYIINI